jgi:SAM-dependent methyltransferase
MTPIFEWRQSDFDKLIANCPDEPVTPFIFRYFSPGRKLLEAGCGSGRFVYWLTEKGLDIEGLEISADTVATLHRLYPQLRIRQGDVRALPYPDNTFDGILSLGVIEHVFEGMAQPIREMHRVLKPGGVALVIVPSFNLIRRLKYPTGIYHLHALLGYLKRWNPLRRLCGKPPHHPSPDPPLAGPLPPFKRWSRRPSPSTVPRSLSAPTMAPSSSPMISNAGWRTSTSKPSISRPPARGETASLKVFIVASATSV